MHPQASNTSLAWGSFLEVRITWATRHFPVVPDPRQQTYAQQNQQRRSGDSDTGHSTYLSESVPDSR